MNTKGRKFVYYRDKRTGKGDEMNFWEWEDIQRNPNKRELRDALELDRIIDLDNPSVETPKEGQSLRIEDDPNECPLCGFIAKSEFGLKVHKKKHK